jgi:oligopeptide transport system permease protein
MKNLLITLSFQYKNLKQILFIRRVLKRALISAITIMIVVSITFILLQLAPGKLSILNTDIPEAVKQQILTKYGLDKPIYTQLLIFWKNFFTYFSFGPSLTRIGSDVNDFIWVKILTTMKITVIIVAISVTLTLVSIVLIALKPGGIVDNIFKTAIPIFVAIPGFILALVFMIIATSTKFPFPYQKENFVSWIFPVLSIAIPAWMLETNYLRTELYSILKDQNIKFAKVKGLGQRYSIMKHALRQCLMPTIARLPTTFIGIFIASNLVEAIFIIPGIGLIYQDAVSSKDYYVIVGVVFFISTMTIIAYILRDFLVKLVNPKLRREGI